jgi:hypothetical protein
LANEAHIKAVITAEDKASATIARFTHGAIGGIETGLKTLATGLAIGGTAMAVFGGLSVKAFTESEDALAQLNAVIKSTGGAAGVTADEAIKLATSLQKTTKFSDEAVLSAENLLLTFTSIGKDIFPQATKTVLNMSTALGQDTKSSAIQLGKALQDPILGVTALRRVGVNFTSAQQDVIKSLVNTGRAAEAQKLILAELEKEFGGSAEAARKTFGGALAALANNFNDLQEKIGGTIANALAPFINQIADFVASQAFQDWMQSAVDVFARFIGKLEDFAKRIWPYAKAIWDEFVGVLRDWVIPALKEAKDKLSELGDQHPKLLLIAGGITAIGLAFAINPIAATIMAVIAAVIALHKIWEDNSVFLIAKWNEINDFFKTNPLGKWVKDEIINSAIQIKKQLGPIWEDLKAFWSENKDTIIGAVGVIGAVILVTIGAAAFTVGWLVTKFRELLDIIKVVTPYLRTALMISTGGLSELIPMLGKSMQKRALGGPVSMNTPYLVGENGPEMFVPHGSGKIIPNNETTATMSGGSNTINLNVNVGVYAGTDIEKRKVAQSMFDALKDIANSKNMTVGELLG